MENETSKKGIYDENYSDIIGKIIINRDKNNTFANGLIFGTSSLGASETKLSQVRKAFKANIKDKRN